MLVVATLASAADGATASGVKHHYSLAGGNAETTLRKFVEQSGEEIVYVVTKVRGVKTNAVSGEFTAREVIELMVAKTGLVVVEDPKTGALMIIFSVPEKPNPPKSSPNPTSMKKNLSGRIATVLLAFASAVAVAQAEAPAPLKNPVPSEELIKLNAFEVSSRKVGPYQVSDTTSGGRIRTYIFESTQGISVVTKELIQDMGATDALNALQLLAGISNNSTSIGDRLSIRGFQAGIGSLDGFSAPASQIKVDPAIFERIEFVRGPNAILSPGGPPGGTINLVTKIAQFTNFAHLNVQAGQYDANRADFDINRKVDNNLAYRLVVATKNHTQGKNQGYVRGLTVLPSLTWRLSDNASLSFEYIFTWGHGLNFTGWPLDPSVSPQTEFKMLKGLNIYQSAYADNVDDLSAQYRTSTNNYRMLYTATISDRFSIRAAARFWSGWDSNNQWNLLGNSGGAIDPKTGFFTPGFTFGPAPDFKANPTAPIPSIYAVSQTPQNSLYKNYEFQNDYAYNFSSAAFTSETSGGISGMLTKNRAKGYAATSAAIDVFRVPNPSAYVINNAANANRLVTSKSLQVYINQNIKLLDGKLCLNVGLAQNWYYGIVEDYRINTSYFTHPAPLVKNYGIVYHPIRDISLYYGHSENASQIVQARQSNGVTNELQDGRQDEVGIRYRFLESKAVASVAFYDSSQSNNSILNPALFSIPPPVGGVPALYMDRVARGWEYELNMAVSVNFSLIANYTNFRNRSPYGTPIRGSSENSGGFFANYKYTQGALKGLSLGLGYISAGKRPGDTGSGYTAASTDKKLIPNQPTFYLPETKLWNLSAGYRFSSSTMGRLFIDNASDAIYYRGALNRNGVYPGIPRNVRATLDYSF